MRDRRAPGAFPAPFDATVGAGAQAFLSDLAGALHVAYLPSDLVERHVGAAARGLGLDVDAFTLQSVVLLQTTGSSGAHLLRTKFSPHWNLAQLHDLLMLSEAVGSGRLALPAARVDLDRILAKPRRWAKPVVVLGYAVYGAAVAARVGGGGVEVLAAGLMGVLAGAVHFGILGHPRGDAEKSFVAALVGTLSAFLLAFVLPPFDLARAVFGAIVLLVPAMVVTLAAYEFAGEAAVESGVVRLTYGLLRFVMMGAGVVAALVVGNVLGWTPAPVEAAPLPVAAVAAALAVGGVALVACMQARPTDAPWIVGAVLFAWGAQEATKLAFGDKGSPFLAALVLGLAGSLYARLPRRTPATVVFPGLLQLAPGFIGSEAVLASVRHGAVPTPETFFEMLTVSMQLVLGLLVGAATAQGLRRGAPPGTAG